MQCSEHFNLRVVIVSSDIHLQSNLMMMTGVSLACTILGRSGLFEDNDNDIVSENSSNIKTTDRTLINWVMSCQDSESGRY